MMARGEKIWLKRANIPIWVIQLLVLLIFTASSAIALYAVSSIENFDDNVGDDVKQVLKCASPIYGTLYGR